jgi:hypothetical protein
VRTGARPACESEQRDRCDPFHRPRHATKPNQSRDLDGSAGSHCR